MPNSLTIPINRSYNLYYFLAL